MENQFIILQPWLGQILNSIKKEIKSEHLAKSPGFQRAHFGNRPLNRLTSEEILQVYAKVLFEGNEELSEWVVNRWVFQNGEIYRHFADRLAQINPDFDAIVSLDEKQSDFVLKGAVEAFGALTVYVFSILNRVVLPQSVFSALRKAVESEEAEKGAQEEARVEQESIEQMRKRHEKELARCREKCDDKIAGVVKKYALETESYKKQIRALQHQINALKNKSAASAENGSAASAV